MSLCSPWAHRAHLLFPSVGCLFYYPLLLLLVVHHTSVYWIDIYWVGSWRQLSWGLIFALLQSTFLKSLGLEGGGEEIMGMYSGLLCVGHGITSAFWPPLRRFLDYQVVSPQGSGFPAIIVRPWWIVQNLVQIFIPVRLHTLRCSLGSFRPGRVRCRFSLGCHLCCSLGCHPCCLRLEPGLLDFCLGYWMICYHLAIPVWLLIIAYTPVPCRGTSWTVGA